MANELYISTSATVTPYAVIRRKSDMRVASIDAETFVTFADADLSDYVVSLASSGGDIWTANFPAWIGSGEYIVNYYEQSGGSAATSDTKLKEADLYWTGQSVESGETPTAAEMVTLIKQALRDNPIGIVTIMIDGKSTQWNRAQALEELTYWKRIAAAEAGTRPRIMSIRLDGGFGN